MKELYLPTEYLNSPCVVVGSDYIRVYTNNNLTQYTDLYYKSHYLERTGYSNYAYTGVCDNTYTYTDNYYRRLDFDNILFIGVTFMLINCIFIYLLYKAFSRGRRLK